MVVKSERWVHVLEAKGRVVVKNSEHSISRVIRKHREKYRRGERERASEGGGIKISISEMEGRQILPVNRTLFLSAK